MYAQTFASELTRVLAMNLVASYSYGEWWKSELELQMSHFSIQRHPNLNFFFKGFPISRPWLVIFCYWKLWNAFLIWRCWIYVCLNNLIHYNRDLVVQFQINVLFNEIVDHSAQTLACSFFLYTLKLDFYLCTLLLMVGVDQGLGYVHGGLLQLCGCGMARLSFETCTSFTISPRLQYQKKLFLLGLLRHTFQGM